MLLVYVVVVHCGGEACPYKFDGYGLSDRVNRLLVAGGSPLLKVRLYAMLWLREWLYEEVVTW